MKRIYALLFASLCLAGCTGAPVSEQPDTARASASVSKTNYGMFVGIGPSFEASMADEAATQLWQIYPPPGNLLDFQQRIAETDSFGRLLMSALQREGFFVHQWFDPAVAPQCGKKVASRKSSGDFRIVPVCYLVDDVSGMLRLTLYTAGDAWSRFFETVQGRLKPLGAWTLHKGE